MQRRQDEVPGHRRPHGQFRGFGIADLAHHQHVGVVAQDGAQRGGEGPAQVGLDLDLDQAGGLDLDRVLDGDDLAAHIVQFGQCCMQRGRLAAARGARHQDQPVRLAERDAQRPEHRGGQVQAVQPGAGAAVVQQAQHQRLAMHGRRACDAKVDRAPARLLPDAAVLRQATLGYVHASQDLQP